jgi:hypothetical protein
MSETKLRIVSLCEVCLQPAVSVALIRFDNIAMHILTNNSAVIHIGDCRLRMIQPVYTRICEQYIRASV